MLKKKGKRNEKGAKKEERGKRGKEPGPLSRAGARACSSPLRLRGCAYTRARCSTTRASRCKENLGANQGWPRAVVDLFLAKMGSFFGEHSDTLYFELFYSVF